MAAQSVEFVHVKISDKGKKSLAWFHDVNSYLPTVRQSAVSGVVKLWSSCLPLRDQLVPVPGLDGVIENTSNDAIITSLYRGIFGRTFRFRLSPSPKIPLNLSGLRARYSC